MIVGYSHKHNHGYSMTIFKIRRSDKYAANELSV